MIKMGSDSFAYKHFAGILGFYGMAWHIFKNVYFLAGIRLVHLLKNIAQLLLVSLEK